MTKPLKSGVGFMPRGGKKSASQLNNRHETGNVAPFQKVPRKPSNGALNGTVVGPTIPRSNTPSASTTQAQPVPTATDNHLRRPSAGIRTSGQDGLPNGSANEAASSQYDDLDLSSIAAAQTHHKIDVTAVKNNAVHDNRLVNIANTIVQSWPLGDTIAILIFLLSLPPTILTLTNVLFAMLTFVPPSGSFASLPTALVDVFQGAGGTPTMLTIFMADLIGVILWLFMWTPVQDLITELSQAVVATTLGGSTASKNRGSGNTIFCMVLVTINHVARKRWIPVRFFGYDWSVRLASMSIFSAKPAAFGNISMPLSRSAGSWVQDLVALHILVQGLLLMVRRWMTKNQSPQAYLQQNASASIGKSSQHYLDGSSLPGPGSQTPPAHGPRAKTSIPSLREAKPSMNKKRKKQATLVRLQQPLWSAVAATKVTVVRELEQSNTLTEASGASATDTKNLGNAPFPAEEGRIWLTKVRPTGFTFGANLCNVRTNLDDAPNRCCEAASNHTNDAQPFHILINGADWTSMQSIQEEGNEHDRSTCGQQWRGEVLGLSPSMTYQCVFICSVDKSVVHIVSIITPSIPTAKQDSDSLAGVPLQAPPPSSPSSPATTLKASIAAARREIEEKREVQKAKQKDQRSANAIARRENDALNAKIGKVGGEDRTIQARQTQWQHNTRQAEETIAAITEEIDLLDSVPKDDLKPWQQKKEAYEATKAQQKTMRQRHLQSKANAQQEKKAAETDATSAHQKREKLQGRGTKLAEQRERLQSATRQGLSEKERKDAERIAQDAEQHRIDQQSDLQQIQLCRRIAELQQSLQQAYQQANAAETYIQQQHVPGTIGETSMDGEYDPSVPPSSYLSQAQGFRFPGGPLGPIESPHPRSKGHSLRQNARNRSGSTASNHSAYADIYDQDPAPPLPQNRAFDRTIGRQKSTGSGSGSGSGSARGPPSPAVSNGPRMSPVGQRSSPKWK